jgi:hypothetical protein
VLLCGGAGPTDQCIHGSTLKRCREIGADIVEIALLAFLADRQHDGCFQPGETEIKARAIQHGARERVGVLITFLSQRCERRPARVTEAQEFGGFVERLTDGVVKGRTEDLVLAQLAHSDQHRVTP